MRRITIILTALTGAAAVQTHAGILDCLFGGPDNIAAKHAKEFVVEDLSKPNEAVFEKVNIIEKDGPAYLFHVAVTAPSAGAERAHLSYLVCFKLDGASAKFHKDNVIQHVSDPPSQEEVSLMKLINGWPMDSSSKQSDSGAVSSPTSSPTRSLKAGDDVTLLKSVTIQYVPYWNPTHSPIITTLHPGSHVEFVSRNGDMVRFHLQDADYGVNADYDVSADAIDLSGVP